MSIQEFTAALRDRASNATATKQAKDLLDRLAKESTKAYQSSGIKRSASILTEDSTKLRALGARQGSTRLIVTENSLQELLQQFGLNTVSEEDAIKLYMQFLSDKYGNKYKAGHFEFYTTDGDILPGSRVRTPLGEYIKSTSGKSVIAIRGLNFSHENTLKHMAEFLIYAKPGNVTGMSLKEVQQAISKLYERGHIVATTTGRQLASIGGISQENDILDKIVQLSVDLDIASSSLSNPKYANILASVNKDFTGNRMFMNIEFQLIRNETGTGNQDSADITRGLQIISTLYNLIDNISLSSRGSLLSTPIGTNLKNAAKQLDNLLKKLEKQEAYIAKVLANYITNPEKYILDLKSSDTFKDQIKKRIVNTINGKGTEPLKIKHKQVKAASSNIPKQAITSVKTDIKKLVTLTKQEIANAKKLANASSAKPNKIAQDYSLASLQLLINTHLQDVISANMGMGTDRNILNYRTGRFAASAKVEKMSQSREGMITAFYSYMKNPYQTFEPGYRQGSPKTRDPKLLISSSIRDIAATKVANRLRAVVI
jgi:hypothetical protein